MNPALNPPLFAGANITMRDLVFFTSLHALIASRDLTREVTAEVAEEWIDRALMTLEAHDRILGGGEEPPP
jgi:hypothetical protein